SPQAPVDNFTLRDDVFLTSNFANDAGCNWQGIAGQVFDANGQPLIGVRVIAMGGGAMLEAESGTATTYGASGWEIKIGDTPAAANYLVAIYDETRGEFAHGISVEFPGTCDANLALLNFVRVF
ncbi:MAG: hypothetical protein K8L99_26850, partial [Anaerolineae bacterium]|nr:hypothetical protein [Anaerolineae bacterium]